MPYLGNIPATQFAELKYQDFTGGSGTSFTLNDPVGSAQELEVFVNNVRQEPGVAYTVSGTGLTMTGSIASTDDFYVVFQGKSTGTATHPAGQALTATDGTFTGDLTVDTNTLKVDSANNTVGIGTTSPGFSNGSGLEVANATTACVRVEGNSAAHAVEIYADSSGGTIDARGSGAVLAFDIGGSEAARIDNSGNVGIGTTSPTAPGGFTTGKLAELKNSNTDNSQTDNTSLQLTSAGRNAALSLLSNSGYGSYLYFGDESDSDAGSIRYLHSDNSLQFRGNGQNRAAIDSAGKFTVSNTAYFASLQNGNSSTERSMHYTGNYLVVASYQEVSLILNRMGNDGSLIHFRQAGNVEGTVSVSGTTVSYNGGHLSRWSQLTDGTRDNAIVKGTVMTNLDQMAVWSHDAQAATQYEEGEWIPEGKSVGDEKEPAKDAYTEDNEQLNCMAVSSVEGDTNVAGVFVNWDDDDDFNDMNIAMTGDMVIRIAQGTTVARGDLLMSAGDGTAKPQGDDIVRSKTIAKVTSTNVSHTYDDGSYLVPCVVMAC